MMAEKISGSGGADGLAHEYFTYDSQREVAVFCIERTYQKKIDMFDLPVDAFKEIERLYSPQAHKTFVAVSYTKLNRARARLFYETNRQSGSAGREQLFGLRPRGG
jgi:hypothetical protein